MKLFVSPEICLTEMRRSDRDALVAYLNDPEVQRMTLRIPAPYTLDDADVWLDAVEQAARVQGQPVHYAIRNAEDALLGAIGLGDVHVGRSREAELGYWLARPYWGRGLMTAALSSLCAVVYDQLALEKLVAHVFAENHASARVLEKCGFHEAARLPQHFRKEGRDIDARRFERPKAPPATTT